MSGRLESIQVLRGLAAWIVVFCHFWQGFFDFECGNALTCFVAEKGNVGVDVFFVISGFVMVVTTWGRNMTPQAFAAKRLARIVPAYWFWTLVVAVLALTLPAAVNNYADASTGEVLSSAVLSVLFIPHDNPVVSGLYPLLTVGWSLNYEMLFYAVFAASLVLRGWKQLVAVAVLLLLVLGFYPWPFPFSEFLHNKLILEFLYGMGLGWCYATKRLPMPRAGGLLAVVGLALIAVSTAQYRAYTWGVGSLLIVYAALCLERYASLGYLRRLGDLSYSTYLAHWPVIVILAGVYRSMGNDTLWPFFLVATVAVVVVLSELSFRFVEANSTPRLQRLLMRPTAA